MAAATGGRFRDELLFAGHDSGRPDPYESQPGVRGDGVGLLVGPAFRSSLLVGALGSPPAAPCGRRSAGSRLAISTPVPTVSSKIRNPNRIPATVLPRACSWRSLRHGALGCFTAPGQFLQVHSRAPDLPHLRSRTETAEDKACRT